MSISSQSERSAPRNGPRDNFGAVYAQRLVQKQTQSELESNRAAAGSRETLVFSIATLAITLMAVVMLSGCASTGAPQSHGDEDAGLYAWVDEELSPYLMDQLGRQPRFRGEPVLLVAMNGADVRPDIDALTRSVRSRLMDRLLVTPGANLYWRPAVATWEHHRSNDRLSCNTASRARYFVGIDLAPAAGGEFRASVRALDVGTAAWVTGFGKTWQGPLSRRQQKALAERRVDEYLRGLRVLPFVDGEPDLLAAYLAQNLSCLLREQGASEYRVFLDPPADEKPKLKKVLILVRHNLAQHQAVQITERAEDAELILSGSLNDIDGHLHQLWVTVRPKTSDTELSSVDTGAYIYLGGSRANLLAAVPVEREPGSRTSLNRHGGVLSKLRVMKTRHARGCAGGVYEPLAAHDAVERGECFRVEFDLYRPARVMVLKHDVDGTLTRLPRNGCTSHDDSGQQWLPRRGVRVSDREGAGFGWAGRPGIESVYALAVMDTEVASELAQHLSRLPDGCLGNAGGITKARDLRPWLRQLDGLIERAYGHVDWQAVRVRHAAP